MPPPCGPANPLNWPASACGSSDLPASLPEAGWPDASCDSGRFRYTWEHIYHLFPKMQAKVILVTWEQLENPKNKKSIKNQWLLSDLVPILKGNFGLNNF